MNRILHTILYLCFTAVSVVAQNTKGGRTVAVKVDQKPGRTFALIAGISKYQHPETYESLDYADDDARAFYHFLRSPDGGNVPDEQIDTLIDEGATCAAFFESLLSIDEQIDTGDLLYIYFSGHGDAYRSDLAFLLPYDAPSGKGKKEKNHYISGFTLIDVNKLKVVLSTMIDQKQVKVVLITDACRTNELPGGQSGQKYAYDVIFEKNMGEIQLISCSSNQVSYESDRWGGGRGLFSWHLINGLRGLADQEPPDGKVTLGELYDYTKRQVNRETYDAQRSMYLQTPRYCCQEKDGFVLSKAASPNGFTPFDPGKSEIGEAPVLFANKGVDLASRMRKAGMQAEWEIYLNRIGSKNLIGDESAYELVEKLQSDPRMNPSLERLLKIHLSSKLYNDVAGVINIYLNAAINNNLYTHEFFRTAYDKLRAYTSIADPLYFDSVGVKVNLLFLEAHSNWKSHKSADILHGLRLLDTAVGLKPEAAYLYNLKGLLHSNMKQYKEADRALKNGLKLAPNWIYPTHNLALNFANRFLLDSAEYYQRKAINLDTNYQTSYNGMAWIKYLKKDMDSAIWYCKRGLTKDPDDPWLWRQLGQLYLELKDYPEAFDAYHQSARADSTDVYVYHGLLRTHIAWGSSTDSIAYYINRMIATDSTDAQVYMSIGTTLREYDVDSMALTYFATACYYDTLSSDAWFERGYTYQKLGNYRYAIYCYDRAAKLEPEVGRGFNQMSILYYWSDLIPEAVSYMEQALARQPQLPVLNNNMGYMYIVAGRYEDAIPPLKKALELDPEYASAHFELARAYAFLKKKKPALEHVRLSIKFDPSQSRSSFNDESAFNKIRKKGAFKKAVSQLQQ